MQITVADSAELDLERHILIPYRPPGKVERRQVATVVTSGETHAVVLGVSHLAVLMNDLGGSDGVKRSGEDKKVGSANPKEKRVQM